MPLYHLGRKRPHIDPTAWIAPNAVIIGDVHLGPNVSIWWNCVLRGDNEPITIGADTNIQDGSILHTDAGVPLTIGTGVTVGHMAMLHGCTIGDYSLIGMGAILLNRSLIGRECLIGAGTLIAEGKELPERSLVLGSPGRVIRQLSTEEVTKLHASAADYVAHAREYTTDLASI
jgi:carbonic anhydrase/acetyltransferase-like protein (isoleucine patch superfamily)